MGLNDKDFLIEYRALNDCKRSLIVGPVADQDVNPQLTVHCNNCKKNHLFSKMQVLAGGTPSRTQHLIDNFLEKGAIRANGEGKILK